MDNPLAVCPLCRSNDLELSFHNEAVHDLFDIKSQQMRLALCGECGFVFQNPVLAGLESTDHYQKYSSYVTLPSPQIQNAKKNQFQWITAVAESSGFAPLLRAGETPMGLFEIGASVGALLAVAKSAGWLVQGLEPSEDAVRVARESYQIRIDAGDLLALERIELPIVTMIHVLEHIQNPIDALRHIFGITPRTGMLTIEVPDFSVPKNAGGSGFFVPEHVNYFTAETLVKAATTAGWSTADIHIHEYKDAGEFCLYPVLRGSFIKRSREDLVRQRALARDLVVNHLDHQAEALRRKFRSFARTNESLVLFGGGWHTQMLLNLLSSEDRAKVRTILDSNPQRAGSEIEGIKIESSSNLPQYRGCGVVVSSQGYQEQIVEQIKTTVGDACPILTFY